MSTWSSIEPPRRMMVAQGSVPGYDWAPDRAVVLVVRRTVVRPDDDVAAFVRALCSRGAGIVALLSSAADGETIDTLTSCGVSACTDSSTPVHGLLAAYEAARGEFAEVVLTDDDWVGAPEALLAIAGRMSAAGARPWELTEGGEFAASPWALGGPRAQLHRSLTAADLLEHATHAADVFTGDAEVVFPARGPRTPAALYRSGCPVIDRTVFTADPLELRHAGIDPREAWMMLASSPSELSAVTRGLVRNTPAAVLHANLSLATVVAGGSGDGKQARRLRVLVLVIVGQGASVASAAALVPGSANSLVLSVSPGESERARRELRDAGMSASVRERATSSPSHGCLGELRALSENPDAFDLVAVMTTDATQRQPPVDRCFFEGVISLFQEEQLGAVLAAPDHPMRRFAFTGDARFWVTRGAVAARALDAAEMRTVDALRTAAATEGYLTRTALTPHAAGVGAASVTYMLDQLASTTAGPMTERVAIVRRVARRGSGGLLHTLRRALSSLIEPKDSKP